MAMKAAAKPTAATPRIINVLRHTGALRQLRPEEYPAHEKVCDWMKNELGIKNWKESEKQHFPAKPKDKRILKPKSAVIVDRTENPQLDYEIRNTLEVKIAKKIEAGLVEEYAQWLEKKGRKLSLAKYIKRLNCDGYEKKRRNNLIEAKASTRRENIRMAVGQLLDYAFLGKEEFGEPNKAILLPKRPDSDIEKWLRHLDISIIWRERKSFKDNRNGQFS